MGYSWMYLGDAEIPADAVESWLATPLGEGHPDVLAALGDWGFEPSDADLTVRDALDQLADDDVAEIRVGPQVAVRVLADKSTDAWLTWRGDLVTAFALLARHGGRGRLDIVGFFDGPDDGCRIEVGGGVTARGLGEDEVEEARSGAAGQELLALADSVYGDFEG